MTRQKCGITFVKRISTSFDFIVVWIKNVPRTVSALLCALLKLTMVAFSKLTRSTFAFSTKKLQDIISDMETDANHIEKLAPIVEARKSRGEREDAAKERLEAGIERDGAKIERLESAEWRQIQQNDRSRTCGNT
jgi:hypothetical protein